MLLKARHDRLPTAGQEGTRTQGTIVTRRRLSTQRAVACDIRLKITCKVVGNLVTLTHAQCESLRISVVSFSLSPSLNSQSDSIRANFLCVEFNCILLVFFSVTRKQSTKIRIRKNNYNATCKTNYNISLDLQNIT